MAGGYGPTIRVGEKKGAGGGRGEKLAKVLSREYPIRRLHTENQACIIQVKDLH